MHAGGGIPSAAASAFWWSSAREHAGQLVAQAVAKAGTRPIAPVIARTYMSTRTARSFVGLGGSAHVDRAVSVCAVAGGAACSELHRGASTSFFATRVVPTLRGAQDVTRWLLLSSSLLLGLTLLLSLLATPPLRQRLQPEPIPNTGDTPRTARSVPLASVSVTHDERARARHEAGEPILDAYCTRLRHESPPASG
ncbi:hypothetical protein PHYSODRAFT_330271 [Phytophthora sojae]|uniref:Uncharacterized protein n=1 Tax=Phytophthora sojae (strain P6497) TaxID=1094619 RepID=G4Z7V0_PHYSP|nr:hypothetical protein PHYSODRAFT_330271 [Phytophthora sojae]EGZ22485.1 hypothetical protein PHYSODRAFT_330271 [Phytophthora sojae]|eukprot:XP_009525202.1 hypothetical protein PHYSODRAFT_330271 [Phytophthora sojae]